jgi:hypothetical protein
MTTRNLPSGEKMTRSIMALYLILPSGCGPDRECNTLQCVQSCADHRKTTCRQTIVTLR